MLRSLLEELAARWVPGEGPVDIHPLSSGVVNESCQVSRGGRLYSLRVAAPNSQDLGLDRRWECRVLQAGAAANVAPVIACCNPGAGILVAEWVSGQVWTPREIRQPGTIDRMAQLLRRIHALPVPKSPRLMNPAAWIAHYAGALARRGSGAPRRLVELRGAADVRLRLLGELRPVRPVLCHGDLHRLNVVAGTVLLDWEYAHVSDPFWDLAGWIANSNWPGEWAGRLSASYLQRSPDSEEQTRLDTLIWLYDYICLMWSELYLNLSSGPASLDVSSRADQLAVRLKRVG